jgi:hypothetical protein
VPLFRNIPADARAAAAPRYDVFPDGSFLTLEDEHPAAAQKPVVVLNWTTSFRN